MAPDSISERENSKNLPGGACPHTLPVGRVLHVRLAPPQLFPCSAAPENFKIYSNTNKLLFSLHNKFRRDIPADVKLCIPCASVECTAVIEIKQAGSNSQVG